MLVWAVFNCARNLSLDPEMALLAMGDTSGGQSAESERGNAIITHACALGQPLDADRNFANQLAASL